MHVHSDSKPVDPVAAVVPLHLAGVIQLDLAGMREGGLHVTVVGHEAGVAGLPAVKALMALEHQLRGHSQMTSVERGREGVG